MKKTGGWRSVAVDGYIRTEGLSMKFVVDLFDREIEMAEERFYPWTFQTIYGDNREKGGISEVSCLYFEAFFRNCLFIKEMVAIYF